MTNKPTMYGLTKAVETAQWLLNNLDPSDLQGIMKAKETLRKSKENLRIFTYKQKAHLTPNGRSIRA